MKKTKLITLALFIFISLNVKSQSRYSLPDGFSTYKDFDGNQIRNDNDFDNDGITDLAIVCTDKNETKVIVIFLSTKYISNKIYSWFPWDYEFTTLKFENKVLDISSSDLGGHQSIELKLKYYSDINNMKLIGYADESNVRNNDGIMVQISKKNINLNTGEYEIAGVKRKVTIDLITISNIEKYFEYLSSIGENYQK